MKWYTKNDLTKEKSKFRSFYKDIVQQIIDNYDTTIYAEEALHRLVEVHYTLGLIDEAEKYAQLLGYNYQSSKWYENSYSLFNKNYKKRKKERLKTYKKKSDGILKKFKSLIE